MLFVVFSFLLFSKKTALLKPSLSDFFFCRFERRERRGGNQHKKLPRREYVERRRLSLRNTLLQKEGRIDLERFFLVENFQRRGERKFALRRVERKEREKGDFNFF